jgi:F-type H+-transporting ATPase subunit delta
MSFEAIAARYAQALFDIGVETGTLGRIADETQSFADTYAASDELRSVLDNPLVPEASRDALLLEVAARLGLGDIVKNTMRLLAQRHRLAVVPAMARTLVKMSDDQQGIVRASVTSAAAMDEAYAKRLQAELEKMMGKRVVLTRKVDTTLLAGVVTRVGDTVIDGSLRTRLNGLKSQLMSM